MRVLDLFSGIGGFSLGLEQAGMETVAFCEIDPFCQRVLRQHWPHVPIYDDVKILTKEKLDNDGIANINLICGGIPCQPWSCAGQQRGAEDDRHLWPYMRRLIAEIRPAAVLLENVTNFISMGGADAVMHDLEAQGYVCGAVVLPACAIGLPIRRDRIFIIAFAHGQRLERCAAPSLQGQPHLPPQLGRGGADIGARPDLSAPVFLGNSNGLPNRVDRTKSLGNSVVPGLVREIGRAIIASL